MDPKKFPKLQTLLHKQTQRRQTPEQMLQVVKMLHAMHGGMTEKV